MAKTRRILGSISCGILPDAGARCQGVSKGQERRGVALILVLVAVATGIAIGVAFLDLASVRMLSSYNLVHSAKAEYLAESGLAEAAYFFSYPHVVDPQQPEAVWAGVAGRQLDASLDYYDVSVAPDPAEPLFFSVLSTSHIFGQSEEILSRSAQASFLINRGFSFALMADHELNIPADISVNGSVYASGNIINYTTISGDVKATGTITNNGTISGEITPDFLSLQMASCSLSNPLTYTYQGTQYQAGVINAAKLVNRNWTVPPADNPMGVYIRYGDLNFSKGNDIVGTLIVIGILTIDIKNNQSTITANPGFPALIAQDNVILQLDGGTMTVNGAFIARKVVQTSTAQNSTMVTNGPVVFLDSGSGFAPSLPGVSFIINHDGSQASVSGLFPPDPQEPRQVVLLPFTQG